MRRKNVEDFFKIKKDGRDVFFWRGLLIKKVTNGCLAIGSTRATRGTYVSKHVIKLTTALTQDLPHQTLAPKPNLNKTIHGKLVYNDIVINKTMQNNNHYHIYKIHFGDEGKKNCFHHE